MPVALLLAHVRFSDCSKCKQSGEASVLSSQLCFSTRPCISLAALQHSCVILDFQAQPLIPILYNVQASSTRLVTFTRCPKPEPKRSSFRLSRLAVLQMKLLAHLCFTCSMVVACLVSGANVRRCLDPSPLPFHGGKRIRRSIKQVVRSEAVDNVLQGLGHVAGPIGVPSIHGFLQLSVCSAYGHTMILSELERELCWYWRSLGVPAEDLWVFRVDAVMQLPEKVPAREYVAKRFNKVFAYVNQDSVRELCSMCDELPAWMQSELDGASADDLHMALLMPEALVVLCMNLTLEHLIVPSAVANGWWRAPRWQQARLGVDLCRQFQMSRDAHAAHMLDRRAYTLQDSGELAADMRVCLQVGVVGSEELLAMWVSRLQEREDDLKLYGQPDRLAVFMQMIELVMLAEKLRDAQNLQDVLNRSLRIVLPPDLLSLAQDMLKGIQKLDKGRISRGHLTLDVAYMLHHRVCNWKRPDKVRYLMWDSSPQFGRDYQMCLTQAIESCELPSMLQSFYSLCELWQTEDEPRPNFDDQAAIEQDSNLINEIHKTLCIHALPTVLIGFGVASFQHKLWALLHAIRLEVFTEGGCSSGQAVLSVSLLIMGWSVGSQTFRMLLPRTRLVGLRTPTKKT